MKVLGFFLAMLLVSAGMLIWDKKHQPTEAELAARAAQRIEKEFKEMPARSLVLLKDKKILLVTKVADDRPYTVDARESIDGPWKRMEFDEVKRKEVLGVTWEGPAYETLAVEFLKKQ